MYFVYFDNFFYFDNFWLIALLSKGAEIKFKNIQFCLRGVRSSALDQTLNSMEITAE